MLTGSFATVSLNAPSTSVTVPFEVFCSITVAPMSGSFVPSSSTLPWMAVWAIAVVQLMKQTMRNNNFFIFFVLVH